jgi:hypothetical protein
MKAGHDKLPYSLVEEMIGNVADVEALRKFGGEDLLKL